MTVWPERKPQAFSTQTYDSAISIGRVTALSSFIYELSHRVPEEAHVLHCFSMSTYMLI